MIRSDIIYSKAILTLLTGALLLLVSTGWSQKQEYVTREQLNQRLQRQYDDALRLIRLGNLEDGMARMEKVLDKEDRCIDCRIQLSAALFDRQDYSRALPYLQQVMAMDPDYRPAGWVILGETLFYLERYTESEQAFKRYLEGQPTEGERTKKSRIFLEHIAFAAKAKNKSVPFLHLPITSALRSPKMEYHPSLTADGRAMVFTRKSGQQEDLYVSLRQDPEWAAPELLEGINTPGNEGAHCISADGRTIVFTACGRPEGYGSCDLYISEWNGQQWSEPRNLGPVINSEAWESMPSLSANGQWLYFSSNRKGGQGSNDIWISRRKRNGQWTPPFNAGPVINSRFNEESPFIHPDGSSLYFMSDGHPGMGGPDLFLSRRDAEGNWSIPENLGYPINTSSNEGGMVVSLDGSEAYMFTNRSGERRTDPEALTDLDIIAFRLPQHLRPAPVTYLRMHVLDRETRLPVNADIDIHRLPEDELFSWGKTDHEGEFFICLPASAQYLFRMSAPGFIYRSHRVVLQGESTLTEPIEMEVLMDRVPTVNEMKAPESDPVVLENIFFESGSANILPDSEFELDGLAAFLESHPGVRIEIRGHTDNVGSESDNLTLSLDRARAVYDALVARGIGQERMLFAGFGESRPVADNDSESGRSKNRRTEFVILQQ